MSSACLRIDRVSREGLKTRSSSGNTTVPGRSAFVCVRSSAWVLKLRMAIYSMSSSLDVISNKIANAHNYGYKSKRADFSAMYAGSTPNGAEVSSITDSISSTGGVRNTGGSMDAMITDRGFFAVRDYSDQVQYTRVGMFNIDRDGYLIDTNGRKVQGYAPCFDASGQLVAGARC